MSDINKWHGSGRLTRDPEVRATQGGTLILAMGMCCNDRKQNQQTGEWEDVPNFIDVTLFGKRVDFLAQRLRKGSKVFVEGRLRWSQWEKNGEKRSKLEVVASEIEFDMPPRQQGAQTYGQGVAPMPAQQVAAPAYQQAPQQYQQIPQTYPQQAPQQYQPQAPQGYQQPPQQAQRRQMAPQPQAPAATPQAPPQAPQQAQIAYTAPPVSYDDSLYDEDIPF